MTTEPYQPPDPYAPGVYRGGPTAPLPPYPPAPYPPAPGYYGPYPGYPVTDRRDERPGTVTGATVLGFIESGVLLFSALWLWIVASIVSAIDDPSDGFWATNFHGLAHFLVVAGVLNVVASALLIAGGVLFLQRKLLGAALYLAGVLVVLATFVTWLVAQDHVFWFGELAFIVLPVVGLLLAVPGGTWRWLRAGRPGGTTDPR